MILFGYTDNQGVLLGNRESRYEPWGSSIGVGVGGLVFQLYVIPIDTGHIALSPQSSPIWSPAFKMEPVLSVSSFIPPSWCSYLIVWASLIGIYCTLALRPPVWENDTNLWVTKFIIHCKMQAPQSRTIKATITMVNIVFHQSSFTQDRTEVQEGMFLFDIAFTWFFMSSKAVDTLPGKSGMYT